MLHVPTISSSMTYSPPKFLKKKKTINLHYKKFILTSSSIIHF